MNAANEAKGFTDTTKYGFPYSLLRMKIPLCDLLEYFITYFSFVRSIGVKCMETLNDAFFKILTQKKVKLQLVFGIN